MTILQHQCPALAESARLKQSGFSRVSIVKQNMTPHKELTHFNLADVLAADNLADVCALGRQGSGSDGSYRMRQREAKRAARRRTRFCFPYEGSALLVLGISRPSAKMATKLATTLGADEAKMRHFLQKMRTNNPRAEPDA